MNRTARVDGALQGSDRVMQFLGLFGILLVVSGAGHVTDAGVQPLLPGAPTVSQLTFGGEALFLLWLLIRGCARNGGQGIAQA